MRILVFNLIVVGIVFSQGFNAMKIAGVKVEGNKIVVAGKVNGDIFAHKRLEVVSSANIQGKMKAPSGQILIMEGANLDAKCKVLIEQTQQKKLSN